MMNKDFEAKLALRTDIINRAIEELLPLEEGPQSTILRACGYSVRNGGKRMRPLFMQSVYRLLGGREEEKLWPFMAGLEMMHSSSLVHDDLPCMDNDRLRRGKPSTWAQFGVDMGTLAGDGLMIYAFETMLKSGFPDDIKLRAMQVLAEKSGIFGMVGGQTVDVELTGNIPDPDTLRFIYEKKTGALIEAAFRMGAIAAGADAETERAFEEAGIAVGMAFQIRDDILDVTSTSEELGKTAHADDRNAKMTWVSFYGLDQSEKDVVRYTDQALGLISDYEEGWFLEELLRRLIDRKY